VTGTEAALVQRDIPLSAAPVRRSRELVLLSGMMALVKVAHIRFCHSPDASLSGLPYGALRLPYDV
jgi:hypothetical protein